MGTTIDVTDLLPDKQYVKQETKKTQIVLHGTSGGHRPDWTIDGWAGDPEKIATHFVVGGKSITDGDTKFDGKTYQAILEKYWAWNLGVKGSNGACDKSGLGIEICNYAYLTKSANGVFYNYVRKPVPANQVCDLGFKWRGYQYWHAFTDAQIAEVKTLILELANRHSINVKRKWDLSSFETKPWREVQKLGLVTHCEYRRDKFDLSPQPKLIEMLNSL